jgi:hypothetical protein
MVTVVVVFVVGGIVVAIGLVVVLVALLVVVLVDAGSSSLAVAGADVVTLELSTGAESGCVDWVASAMGTDDSPALRLPPPHAVPIRSSDTARPTVVRLIDPLMIRRVVLRSARRV